MTDLSTVDVLRAELADLKDQRRRHADTCVGVDQRGFRGPGFFEAQATYTKMIRDLEWRIVCLDRLAKEPTP